MLEFIHEKYANMDEFKHACRPARFPGLELSAVSIWTTTTSNLFLPLVFVLGFESDIMAKVFYTSKTYLELLVMR